MPNFLATMGMKVFDHSQSWNDTAKKDCEAALRVVHAIYKTLRNHPELTQWNMVIGPLFAEVRITS
jgi:hypothetical protein